MSEFKTIANLVAQAIGNRFAKGQFAQVYAVLNREGRIDNLTRDRVLVAIVSWIEQHETDCVLTNPSKSDTLKAHAGDVGHTTDSGTKLHSQ